MIVRRSLKTAGRRGWAAALAAALGVAAVLAVVGGTADRPSPGATQHHAWAASAWNSTGEPPVN